MVRVGFEFETPNLILNSRYFNSTNYFACKMFFTAAKIVRQRSVERAPCAAYLSQDGTSQLDQVSSPSLT